MNGLIKIKNNSGAAIIKLIAAIAIVGFLVIVVVPRVIIEIKRSSLFDKNKADLQTQARSIVTLIADSLYMAKQSTIVIDSVTAGGPFSRITFTTIDGRLISFYQSGGSLMMKTNDSVRTVSAHLHYLAFAPPRAEDLSLISVTITLRETTYDSGDNAFHTVSQMVPVMNS